LILLAIRFVDTRVMKKQLQLILTRSTSRRSGVQHHNPYQAQQECIVGFGIFGPRHPQRDLADKEVVVEAAAVSSVVEDQLSYREDTR
jgi:hypothetical protein